MLVLLITAVLCVGYAVYRSTGERITITETGRETIYGEPQHGITLGLCTFAGFCVLGASLLAGDRHSWKDERESLSKRTL